MENVGTELVVLLQVDSGGAMLQEAMREADSLRAELLRLQVDYENLRTWAEWCRNALPRVPDAPSC